MAKQLFFESGKCSDYINMIRPTDKKDIIAIAKDDNNHIFNLYNNNFNFGIPYIEFTNKNVINEIIMDDQHLLIEKNGEDDINILKYQYEALKYYLEFLVHWSYGSIDPTAKELTTEKENGMMTGVGGNNLLFDATNIDNINSIISYIKNKIQNLSSDTSASYYGDWIKEGIYKDANKNTYGRHTISSEGKTISVGYLDSLSQRSTLHHQGGSSPNKYDYWVELGRYSLLWDNTKDGLYGDEFRNMFNRIIINSNTNNFNTITAEKKLEFLTSYTYTNFNDDASKYNDAPNEEKFSILVFDEEQYENIISEGYEALKKYVQMYGDQDSTITTLTIDKFISLPEFYINLQISQRHTYFKITNSKMKQTLSNIHCWSTDLFIGTDGRQSVGYQLINTASKFNLALDNLIDAWTTKYNQCTQDQSIEKSNINIYLAALKRLKINNYGINGMPPAPIPYNTDDNKGLDNYRSQLSSANKDNKQEFLPIKPGTSIDIKDKYKLSDSLFINDFYTPLMTMIRYIESTIETEGTKTSYRIPFISKSQTTDNDCLYIDGKNSILQAIVKNDLKHTANFPIMLSIKNVGLRDNPFEKVYIQVEDFNNEQIDIKLYDCTDSVLANRSSSSKRFLSLLKWRCPVFGYLTYYTGGNDTNDSNVGYRIIIYNEIYDLQEKIKKLEDRLQELES